MPAGMRLWDASGDLIFDTTARTFTFLGDTSTGTSDGSVSITLPSGVIGNLTYFVANKISAGRNMNRFPSISLSGSTLSWTFSPSISVPDRLPCLLVYGVW